jgi:hypothetical protein
LYFAATSGVCLIRSGAAGFQKKLQSQKKRRRVLRLVSPLFCSVGL